MWNGIVGKQAANPPPRIGLLIRGLLSEGHNGRLTEDFYLTLK